MTREEAIRRIEEHMIHHHIGEYPHIFIGEALEMAIAALREKETVTKCNDLYDEDGGEILNRTESDTVKPVEIDQFKTNADHIRSMTDEELAELLLDGVYEKVCPNGCDGCDGDCEGHMLNWLKQPYEEK